MGSAKKPQLKSLRYVYRMIAVLLVICVGFLTTVASGGGGSGNSSTSSSSISASAE